MRIAFFLLGLLVIPFILRAQDINFSQFYELPLLRNPALAGFYDGDLRVTAGFRSQWSSVSVPYQTSALGVETKFGLGAASSDYLSIGVQVTNDVAGDSRMGKTQILPLVAYHKSISGSEDTYLTLGFLGGAVNQRFDPSKLKFDDQFLNGAYSPTNPTRQTFSRTNVTYWDAAAGLSFSSVLGMDTRFYIGASYFHFNEPKVAFDRTQDVRLNRKWVVNGGVSIPTGEFERLSFYGDYFIQGGNEQFQGGVIFRHDLLQTYEDEVISLSAGAFYRWNDAVIPLIKLDYYRFGLGLTYDVNISKLRPASSLRGGFELTLSYKNFLNIKNSSADKTRCPVSFDKVTKRYVVN